VSSPDPDARFEYTNSARTGDAGRSVLVIACGAIAREVVAVIEQNGLRNIDITCLPAIWHNYPDRIPEGVREKIREGKKRYDRIFVAYGDCGTGGLLDKVLEEEGGVERLPGPHCYAFFTGTDTFMTGTADEIDAFYLTDYLARHFDTLIWKGFGIEKHPELRDMLFAHYRKVVFLVQVPDEGLLEVARGVADKLELAFEVRHTGYGDLTASLQTANDGGKADADVIGL